MSEADDRIAGVADRHNLSVSAVQALAEALEAGHGGAAQWNHPDLGGMGQWSGGGMLQIGDMFNAGLKARGGSALDDLAKSKSAGSPANEAATPHGTGVSGHWWPSHLGTPSSTGAQNAMRYACFPDKKRLVVERDGKTTVYDTGDHRLTGFSQAQSGTQRLEFSGPDGRVTLDDLKVVS